MDIVERARQWNHTPYVDVMTILADAVEEIERLRARVAELEAMVTPRSKSGPPDEPCEVLLVSRGQWSGTGFIGGPLTGWLPMPAPPVTEDKG